MSFLFYSSTPISLYSSLRSTSPGWNVHDKAHWIGLVEQSQLSVLAVLIGRVHENSSIEQRSMNICDHTKQRRVRKRRKEQIFFSLLATLTRYLPTYRAE